MKKNYQNIRTYVLLLQYSLSLFTKAVVFNLVNFIIYFMKKYIFFTNLTLQTHHIQHNDNHKCVI